MRIGVNAAFLGERPTGVGVFTRQIARALKREPNQEVRVFCSVLPDGIEDHERVPTPAAGRGSSRLSGNLLRFAYTNLVLPGAARRSGVDVLFCPITEYPHGTDLVCVVHVHDLHPLEFPGQFGLATPRFRWELGRLRGLRGRITVSSRHVRDRLLEQGIADPERIDVIPLAYDRESFSPADPSRRAALRQKGVEGPYILYVGSLLPYKNVDALRRAFDRIRGDVGHRLVIAGGRPGELGTIDTDRVCHLTGTAVEDLRDLYSFADLVVYPSLSEGFGLVPLEAMACGAPVIATDRAAVPGVVGDAGLLVDPTDEAALAEAMLLVLNDPERADGMRTRGVARATAFSWEGTARGIVASCARALAEA